MSEWGVWDYIVILYLVGIVPAMLVVARFMIRLDKEHHESLQFEREEWKLCKEQLAFAAIMGICVSPAWPLILPGIWIAQVIKNDYAEPPKVEKEDPPSTEGGPHPPPFSRNWV